MGESGACCSEENWSNGYDEQERRGDPSMPSDEMDRVCIDYRKLNSAMKNDPFPLPFIDQILDQLVGSSYFCFLNGHSGYNQIAINPDDQEKRTFTFPFGTFAFRRMLFGLCNAPATVQRCMTAIFSDFLGATWTFSWMISPSLDKTLRVVLLT